MKPKPLPDPRVTALGVHRGTVPLFSLGVMIDQDSATYLVMIDQGSATYLGWCMRVHTRVCGCFLRLNRSTVRLFPRIHGFQVILKGCSLYFTDRLVRKEIRAGEMA